MYGKKVQKIERETTSVALYGTERVVFSNTLMMSLPGQSSLHTSLLYLVDC